MDYSTGNQVRKIKEEPIEDRNGIDYEDDNDPNERPITIGRMEQFDQTKCRFCVYIDKLQRFLRVNHFPESQYVDIFLTVISVEHLQVLIDTFSPISLNERSFQELVLVLAGHLESLSNNQNSKPDQFTDFDYRQTTTTTTTTPPTMIITNGGDLVMNGNSQLFLNDIDNRVSLTKQSSPANDRDRSHDRLISDYFCFRCGRHGHQRRSCPVRNTFCNFCHSRSHMRSVCKRFELESSRCRQIDRFDNLTRYRRRRSSIYKKSRSSRRRISDRSRANRV